MCRYFKIVTLGGDKYSSYLKEEIEQKGRVHFGWGWHDLRQLKNSQKLNDSEKVVWRYSKFMLERLNKGDRLVVQFERPLRKFMIVEVSGEYGYNDPPGDDFNHFRPCRTLTPLIDIDSAVVSRALRHDLSKRGHYYQIYSEDTIQELDELIKEEKWNAPQYSEKRTVEAEWADTIETVVPSTFEIIGRKWKATSFEQFVARLVENIPGIEVSRAGDSRKGWDMLIRIFDPLSGEIMFDEVPVQCKNHIGIVNTERPIEDLKRCIENSGKSIAYLFILGDLPDQFTYKINNLQQALTSRLNQEIKLVVVDQEQIAKLFMRYWQ
ncbi:MAG: hypothetical protein FH749_09780 [Firmicutes bacterium]|nr:hypothetical protein [Bacillota bacterium]